MAPATPRLRILSVGGNAVSAFLSWRLQATNACDVTLVWKTGYENVAQYGISFKSRVFGNERFKPHSVVKSPEDAPHSSKAPFDYVLLCVKALPDVYDIAAIIETVVSPQHTCILINTTHTLGIESYLEQRFPTNVVLSLVSGAEIAQLGAAEFEHRGETEIYVGAANKNPAIPPTIQADMAEALAMTLSSGEVNCRVSSNIRQQQYDRMIGPIAFHPLSVLFECPNHADLLEKVGVNQMVKDVINELLQVATAQGCSFPGNFREKTIEAMIQPTETPSTMFQDFQAKRPMEIETFLGSPMKLAQEVNVKVPRIETLYAVLHQLNITNQQRPAPPSPTAPAHPPPRLSSAPVPRPPPMTNGSGPPMKNGMRGVSKPMMNGGPPPGGPGPRRGPPPANGFPPRMSSNGYNGPPIDQRNSVEGNELEEFSHVMLYDNVPDGAYPEGYNDGTAHSLSSDLALRERELALRQRELALREQEYRMRSRQRGPPPPMSAHGGYDDDDDEGDYFDPMAGRGPNAPVIDDNFDMMSITSRRNRKTPSGNSMRGPPMGRKGPFGRPKNRTSARMMADVPGLHDSLMDDPLMGYSSNRYGTVDRHAQHETRANSLTAARLDELSRGASYGGYPQMRRTSASPGNPLSPGPKMGGRPSPPNGFPQPNGMQPNGMQPNGRPSPPGVRQPVPRHPPGHGNAVAPQQVEQHVGRAEW